MKDSINMGNQSIHLTKNATNAGFNLIGNPFAADIDMSKLQIGDHVLPNYYVWDPYLGTMGGYACYPFAASIILPSFAAFFAQTNDSVIGNTIQFTEACKIAVSNPIRILGVTDEIKNQLAISIEADSLIWDRYLMIFNSQSFNSIDRFDAKKMMNPELNLFSLSSEKEKLCIDARSISQPIKIPVSLNTSLEKKFSLRVNKFPDLPAYDIYLLDRIDNNKILMRNGLDYSFQTTKRLPLNDSSRFELQLIPKQINASASNNQNFSCKVFPNPVTNNLLIQIHASQLLPITIRISNSNGQFILTEKIDPQRDLIHSISMSNRAAGIYWISVFN